MKNKKQLAKIISKLYDLKEEFETLKDSENEKKDEAQDRYDEKSENWQGGDKGTEMYEMLGQWDCDITSLEDAFNSIDDALSALEMIEIE